jgi:cephalosporin hydroxylase
MKTIEEAIQSVKDFDWKNSTQEEIENSLPTFGMNNEQLFEMPKEFEPNMGWGIKFWQYPNQLSKLITYLRDKEINSYLEIGVRWGGTFVIMNEVLRTSNPHIESFANDIIDASEILDKYQNKFIGNGFSYLQSSSNDVNLFFNLSSITPKPQPQIDCVFIDGCHYYWCIKEDYQRALNLGAKYIIFHDIVSQSSPASKMAWNDIKKKHKKTYEFTDQYDSLKGTYLGIGVVEVTKDDDIFPFYKEYYPDLF